MEPISGPASPSIMYISTRTGKQLEHTFAVGIGGGFGYFDLYSMGELSKQSGNSLFQLLKNVILCISSCFDHSVEILGTF